MYKEVDRRENTDRQRIKESRRRNKLIRIEENDRCLEIVTE